MDANDPLAAALESATLAPALNDVTVGRDDSFTSGVERLFAVIAQLPQIAVGLLHAYGAAQQIDLPDLDVARRILHPHAAGKDVVTERC